MPRREDASRLNGGGRGEYIAELKLGQGHRSASPARKGHGGLLTGDPKTSRYRAGSIALSYMLCAVLLIFFNKLALSSYAFNHANLITLLQLVCSTVVLAVLVRAGVVSLTKEGELGGHSRNRCVVVHVKTVSHKTARRQKTLDDGCMMRFVSMHVVKAILPLSMSYLLYMVMGMTALRGVNLPMYTTLRRTTAAFTMGAEYLVAGKSQPQPILGSVALMVLGALVAGLRDLRFDAWGYLLVFASNASTAVYLSMISRYGSRSSLNSFGLMWCNGLVCIPLLTLYVVASGELSAALAFAQLGEAQFQAVLAMSCVLAFALNYTIFMNTAVNSALTQTVCGNLKDVFVILIGFSSFNDAVFDPINAAGIALGVLGSVAYAVVKLR